MLAGRREGRAPPPSHARVPRLAAVQVGRTLANVLPFIISEAYDPGASEARHKVCVESLFNRLARIEELKAAGATLIQSTLAESTEAFEQRRGMKRAASNVRQMAGCVAALRAAGAHAAGACVAAVKEPVITSADSLQAAAVVTPSGTAAPSQHGDARSLTAAARLVTNDSDESHDAVTVSAVRKV